MKVEELVSSKEYKTTKINIHTRKRKRKRNIKGDTDPHFSNIDTHYGMTGAGRGAVIQS